MKHLVIPILILTVASAAMASTELGIQGTSFTLNGKPTFLLGVSYYGALGASEEFILRDLEDMQRCGFNWIRVWATWAAFENDVSCVDAEGNPRKSHLDKLRWLIGECDRRGMIVDVTLSRGNGIVGPARLQTQEALSRAVQTLVSSLKEYRNWYLDLGNERNIKDKRFVSFEELIQLKKLVKNLDPKRLVTASFVRDIDKDELRANLIDVQVDFISPHRPRNPDSPKQTAAQTRKYLEWMKEIGRIVPVHYQEPFRRGFTPDQWEPKAEEFLTDLEAAKQGGAAGWCFHNGDQKDKPANEPRRSFDMRKARLFDQLDEEEIKFIRQIKQI